MSSVYCPGCGAEVSEQAKYCDKCGSLIPQDKPTAVLCSGNEGTCRLKKLLVIILGCTVWTIMIVYRLFSVPSTSGLLYTIRDTAIYGAMILHHVLKKRAFPVILASIGLACVLIIPIMIPAMYGINISRYLAGSWPGLLLSVLMAVLLLLYTILGKKSKDNIAWMLVHLALLTINTVLSFRFNIFSLILTIHMTLLYVVGYSPDFWYRRRR